MQTSSPTTLASLLIALLGAAGTALAALPQAEEKPRDPKDSPLWKALDRDQDGRIQRGEWRSRPSLFGQLDGNGDGVLTPGEFGRLDFEAYERLRPLLGERARMNMVDPSGFDQNRDGRLSAKEYQRYVFGLADQDGDAALDVDEVDALAGWPGFADAYRSDPAHLMKELDRSKDGRIVEAEFRVPEADFTRRDRDRNGQLTSLEIDGEVPDELAALAQHQADQVLEKLDRSRNGKLEVAELPGGPRSPLARLDRDGDGVVSRDELDRALKYLQRYQYAMLPETFLERYDRNADRRVSRAEFPGDDAAFARLDRNGDGYVNRADG